MTTNYMIKNCPALDDQGRCFQGSVLLGTAFKECEEKDCLLKQMVLLCKQKVEFCKNCSKFADVNIDCVECDERGEATLGRCLLQLFEIEEVNNDR